MYLIIRKQCLICEDFNYFLTQLFMLHELKQPNDIWVIISCMSCKCQRRISDLINCTKQQCSGDQICHWALHYQIYPIFYALLQSNGGIWYCSLPISFPCDPVNKHTNAKDSMSWTFRKPWKLPRKLTFVTVISLLIGLCKSKPDSRIKTKIITVNQRRSSINMALCVFKESSLFRSELQNKEVMSDLCILQFSWYWHVFTERYMEACQRRLEKPLTSQ